MLEVNEAYSCRTDTVALKQLYIKIVIIIIALINAVNPKCGLNEQ